MNTISRQRVATFIALAFYIPGFVAIVVFESRLVASLAPVMLLLSLVLIFWTQQFINRSFLFFCLLSFLIGFVAEFIGINTGILFGKYVYGDMLGPKWKGVPLIIGVQWLILTYCIGICMQMLHREIFAPDIDLQGKTPLENKAIMQRSNNWLLLSTVIDGGLLAVLFDWVLEPAAIKLGYWHWDGNQIPRSNFYSCWLVSVPLLLVFHYLPFKKQNIFALHLLLIMLMFFLLLNTFG